MKKTAIIVMMAIASLFAPACNSKNDKADKKNEISAGDVPSEVKNSFAAKYPSAADVVWEDAHENNVATYKVKFKLDDKKMKAEYNKDGSLIKEKTDD
jgi:hypothetical protein